MTRALVLLALAACSSASPRTEDPGATARPVGPATPGDAATATDAGSASTIAGPGCPATFAAARGACAVGASCTYAEGQCACEAPQWCAGVPGPPDLVKQPASWRCAAAGACPLVQPRAGSACPSEGASCDYTCKCVAISECHGGVWVSRSGPCKPAARGQ